MALWHLDALCYEGYEGHGTANGLPQPRKELAEIIEAVDVQELLMDGCSINFLVHSSLFPYVFILC